MEDTADYIVQSQTENHESDIRTKLTLLKLPTPVRCVEP